MLGRVSIQVWTEAGYHLTLLGSYLGEPTGIFSQIAEQGFLK